MSIAEKARVCLAHISSPALLASSSKPCKACMLITHIHDVLLFNLHIVQHCILSNKVEFGQYMRTLKHGVGIVLMQLPCVWLYPV